MLSGKLRKYIIRIFRLLAWLLGSFFVIFLLVIVILQFTAVQTWITGRIASRLAEETGAVIEVERVAIRFPKSLGLKGIYIEDPGGDTLVHAGSIYADIRMTALLKNRLHINSLEIDNLTGFITREKPDTVFNFQFLADTFATGAENKEPVNDGREKQGIVPAKEKEMSPSGENGSVPAKEESPFSIHLNRVNLKNINIHFEDHFSGTRLISRVGYLQTRLDRSDLLNGKYHAGKTVINESNVHLYTYEPSFPPDEPDPETPDIDISLVSLDITDSGFFAESRNGSYLGIETAMLNIIPESFSLQDKFINVNSLKTENLSTSIIRPPDDETAGYRSGTDEEIALSVPEQEFRFSEIMAWTVGMGSMDITNSLFSLRKENTPLSEEDFDPGNFSLGNIDLSAENLFAGPDSLHLDLSDLNMLVSEIFRLDHMSLELSLGTRSSAVDLRMQTAGSRIGLDLDMEADLLDFATEHLFKQDMFLTVEDTHVNEDLAFFFPAIRSYYFNWPDTEAVEINGRITGSVANIALDSLQLTGPGLFQAFIEGDIAGLPQTDHLFLDISDLSLFATPGEFFANMPDKYQLSGVSLPEFVYARGRFLGAPRNFETEMEINSSMGDASVMASMNGDNGQQSSFEGQLFSGSFDIAKLLQTELFQQPVSFDLGFRGEGLEPEIMELEATLEMGQLLIMDYSYDDIKLDLALKDSVASVSASYSDAFLAMDINAGAGIFKETATAKGEIRVDYAVLDELGVATDQVVLGTEMEADIVFDPADFFSGNIIISNTNIAVNGDIYSVPEMVIRSDSRPQDYLFEFSSGFLNTTYKGNITPAGIPGILAEHLTDYFSVPDTPGQPDNNNYTTDTASASGPEETAHTENKPAVADITTAGNTTNSGDTTNSWNSATKGNSINTGGTTDAVDTTDKYFDIEMHLYPDDVISSVLVPAIEKYDTLSVSAVYESLAHKLTLNAAINQIHYGGLEMENFEARVSSDPGKMNFGIFLNSLNINETQLYDFDLGGSFFEETLDFSFSFKDDQQRDIFLIDALVESREEMYHFSIDPGNLILNYENWEIHPENTIVTGREYLRISNFILENHEALLSVSSRDVDEYDDFIHITLRQFDLYGLTSFAEDIVALRSGVLDGNITIRDIYRETSFTADLSIKNLIWEDHSIELINLQAEDIDPGHIHIDAAMEHKGTALSARGDYCFGEDPLIDMEIIMDKLNLQLIEIFVGDNITHLSGFVTGKMDAEGHPARPELTGELNFTEAAFRVPQLNAGYFLKKEQVTFDRHNIRLQDFILEDSLGRRAGINGTVDFEDFDNLIFNLRFITSNFLLMNLQERQNDMYYGRLLVDSDLRIRGSHHNPSVEGSLKLNKGSEFNFRVPQTTPEAIGGEGVVEFIPPEEEELFREVVDRVHPDELRSAFELLTVKLNVELDRETELMIIIDEIAGDHLELQGGGVLTFGIEPGGIISLTGRYEITGGEYLLSFHEVARRNFRIREGSNIIWTGDPLEAELDITAIYTVRTGAEELMRPNIRADQAAGARIRRQYPFLVYLNLQGDLMAPHINFELDMPPEHRGALDGSIMARINEINGNESELNKQVFALLILGSFIHENPFAAAMGPGIGTTVRSSASQILSQQLNRLSDEYIRGINISFELESYEVDREEHPVGRTELQMEVSRDFFNDRVRVVVGGNIELEDETHRQTSPGDIAGDFSFEYLITPEGNLIFRGFRKKEYGDLIEGELTRTGVSLVFSRSYDRFRDLFKREEETEVPMPEEDEISIDKELEDELR